MASFGAMLLSAQTGRAADSGVPAQPTDPAAAKAYGVFDQACASCHQAGKLKGSRTPAGSLGDILDLESVARNISMVVPGNADASPLYTSMQSRAMPVEGAGETAPYEITATQLASVRDWIERLPVGNACADRTRIDGKAVADAVAAVIGNLDAAHASTTRFVSLAPLYNTCASDAEIDAAREAIALLMNSLSLTPEPQKLPALEPRRLLLQVDLAAFGWTAQTWDRLAARAPAAPFLALDAQTKVAAGTERPVVQGDWLADTATRAPLYYELLGLPESLPALLASLRIDLTNVARGAADRIGIRTSQVARGNRLLERRVFANGTAWFSSEFAPTSGRPDLFDLTIAAVRKGADGVQQPPVHADATLVHFDLPNGFPAFFAANPGGNRTNDVPPSILKDDAHPTSRVSVAQGCLGCHGGTSVLLPGNRTDDLKARIVEESGLSKELRERLLALHSDQPDLQRKIEEDRGRFARAAAMAGVDPARKIGGLDPLPALVARYRRDVTAEQLADLVEMTPLSLFDLGRKGTATVADMVHRIEFGPVPRSEVDAAMPEIAELRGLNAKSPSHLAVPGTAIGEAEAQLMRLVLKADKPTYQRGDLLKLTARSNASCYLTILAVDERGRGTVLYPNEFEPNNFIEVGHEIHLPGDKAPYQLRLRDKGQETMIGICATMSKSVDGIHHNFEMERFTELGDYRAFLNRNWGQRIAAESGSKARVVSRHTTAGTDADAAVKGDVQTRTAIRVTVE